MGVLSPKKRGQTGASGYMTISYHSIRSSISSYISVSATGTLQPPHHWALLELQDGSTVARGALDIWTADCGGQNIYLPNLKPMGINKPQEKLPISFDKKIWKNKNLMIPLKIRPPKKNIPFWQPPAEPQKLTPFLSPPPTTRPLQKAQGGRPRGRSTRAFVHPSRSSPLRRSARFDSLGWAALFEVGGRF